MTPRNTKMSPERRSIETVLFESLEATPEPLSSYQVAALAGVPLSKTRAMLKNMKRDGWAEQVGTQGRPLWRAVKKAAATKRAATPENPPLPSEPVAGPMRICNSAQPVYVPGTLSPPTPMRAGADDHLRHPSRRGERLVPYRAPMLIGSGGEL